MSGRGLGTRVKICGVTRVEDALAAAALGADAIGLVFHEASPRAVSAARAHEIVAGLPPFISVVGLFVDAEPEAIRSAMAAVPLDIVQLHGVESPEYCARLGCRYIKAIAVTERMELDERIGGFADAAAILLDAHHPELPGGSGRRFDWDLVPPERSRPLVLAGGLTADNVGDAIRRVRPFAVDVSSGVESAKGIKDPNKMASFISEVRRVDQTRGI